MGAAILEREMVGMPKSLSRQKNETPSNGFISSQLFDLKVDLAEMFFKSDKVQNLMEYAIESYFEDLKTSDELSGYAEEKAEEIVAEVCAHIETNKENQEIQDILQNKIENHLNEEIQQAFANKSTDEREEVLQEIAAGRF